MLDAVLWGLIQGLTEFLPISSSGHLVLVPALLGRDGPDLATSAMLHLGTLAAVLAYYRTELAEMLRLTTVGKRLLRFLVIGTIPAATAGLLFETRLERLNEQPRLVAVAMLLAGGAMVATRWIAVGLRRRDAAGTGDAVVIGLAQAVALIPGVSRSGATIAAGLNQKFARRDSANLAFLLGIPAIAGAGLLSFVSLAREGAGGIEGNLFLGMGVAAVAGYAAIALLLGVIRRTGLVPFGWYCIGFALLSLVLL